MKCLLGLNTQSLANNVTFEGYGNFRRLSSAGENTPMWVGPEVLQIDVISYLNSVSWLQSREASKPALSSL